MALTVSHSTPADGTFSAAGEAAWEAAHTVTGSALAIGDAVSGGTATRLLYVDGSGNLGESANLTFVDSTKLLSVGTGSGTSAGWQLGYGTSSGYSGLWSTVATADTNDYVLLVAGGQTYLGGGTANTINISPNGTVDKVTHVATSGAGPSITAGTATTDVAALSLTRTNNDAAVATGVKWTFTDTTSAAGFLPFQILGGAAGTTNLLKVSKAGLLDAPAYAVNGGAGASGTGTVISAITVVNGIVTAITVA